MTDRNLAIVESPSKAKTIAKILGADFTVRSSMGHVRDLPEKKLGIDIENGFKPDYVPLKGRKQVIDALLQEAKNADTIYLAPDPDREGEAIAWHLKALLEKAQPSAQFLRVSYNEVTPRAVREAFSNPHEINMKRVDAQQARRVVDRIVGYKVSPLLWSKIRRGASAGRVQSVALRLLCEREAQIRKFVPEPYWLVGVKARKLVDPVTPFLMKLDEVKGEKADLKSEPVVAGIMDDLRDCGLQVVKIATRDQSRRAPPPFITSTLQQAASTRFKMSPAATMRLAQKLYEGVEINGEPVGLITYMRTDAVFIAQEAMQACRKLIGETIGAEYVPDSPNYFKSRAGAQGAHEAIRPTDVFRTPEVVARYLNPTELRIYKLIWERFVASQMKPALIRQRSVDAAALCKEGARMEYVFRAGASEVLFQGYLKIAGMWHAQKDAEEAEEAVELPPLVEGERLECLEWKAERKETQPPRRYSEASLIRELEENGVGRPSTYAMILSTLANRNYATRLKGALVPTDLGMQVSEFLVASLGELFDVGFTALMEKSLDEIEEGTQDWGEMLRVFYDKFSVWMEKAKGPPADLAKVKAILDGMARATSWDEPVKTGKRTYSDEKFVSSLKDQMDKGKRPISERQLEALVSLAFRYEERAQGIKDVVASTGMGSHYEKARTQVAMTDAIVMRKLELLLGVKCHEAVTRGKKVYDDRVFLDSLKRRADSGRGLTSAQLAQVDRLALKYSAQIPDFDGIKHELKLVVPEHERDPELAALVDAMAKVTQWRDPVTRGTRVFDDRAFFESLKGQFQQRGSLSPKQAAALKKMTVKYRVAVPQAAPDGGGNPPAVTSDT